MRRRCIPSGRGVVQSSPARTGKKVSGYTDTGVTLIAAKPLAGVDSKDVKTGTELCWGKK